MKKIRMYKTLRGTTTFNRRTALRWHTHGLAVLVYEENGQKQWKITKVIPAPGFGKSEIRA